jgi:ABC-type arginine transport system ATPase subunit
VCFHHTATVLQSVLAGHHSWRSKAGRLLSSCRESHQHNPHKMHMRALQQQDQLISKALMMSRQLLRD